MLYPPHFEEKIGFNKIKNLIRDRCQGELGQSYVDKIKFSSNPELIAKLTSQTNDFLQIIKSGESVPFGEYFNIKPLLTKASKIGAYLIEEEFHVLKLTLSNIDGIIRFFNQKQNGFENLSVLLSGIYLNPSILLEINRVIDERGVVRNNASSNLMSIRDDIQKLEFKVRSKTEKLLKKFIADGYSNDDSNITLRNGRLVIPVRSEFKRVAGGLIHDESSSGQTSFIEPTALVEINNEIRTLTHQEKREIIRILTMLTDLIRPEVPELLKCYDFLGLIDFIRSKALLAVDLEAILPESSKYSTIQWVGARHPVLYLSHKMQNKTVVPLNIQLDHKERILIISGPNAGGKSICLQTVVLIQYMYQCGLLIPVQEGTRAGIFQQIFIDIGDEQSVENDLSTYSSHLINMKHFVSYANSKTLFLIDEFGTGTEPQFGGAIAESILDKLRKLNAFGIITTHYTNLKKYAERYDGVINGAMRFDLSNMEPLFQLEVGKPGSSFALEISKKIGLPEDIIHHAQKLIGTTHVNFERLIGELEQEKKELEDQKIRINTKETELEALFTEYGNLKNFLEEKQNNLIYEAKQKAAEILKDANREIEKTIRIIKEEKADKEKTRLARQQLEDYKKEIIPQKKKLIKKEKKQSITIVQGPVRVNDYVRIKDSNTIGMVMKIDKKTADVAIGNLNSKIELSRLEKVSKQEFKLLYKDTGNQKNYHKGIDLIEKGKQFSNVLDIRGKRAEEAIAILSGYIDEAYLLNRSEVRILHGKGDGILRQIVSDFLKDFEFVASVKEEIAEKGGAGISVIHFK